MCYRNNYSLEKRIAMLYILLLPLRMPTSLVGVTGIFSACATYFDFILHIFGFTLMLMTTHGQLQTNRYANMFVKLVVFLEIISLSMAVFLHNSLGMLDGDDTLTAIFGPSIYYIHYLVIMFYNIYIFGMFTKEEISRIIDKLVLWNLILGYVQILICNGSGFIAGIYDSLDVFNVFRQASYITNISRIPVSGSEPAAAGCFIGILVFPYLMSKIISGENAKKNYIQILLWLPVIFFTKSSTCYILVLVDLLVFFILGMKNRCFGTGTVVLLAGLCIGVLILSVVSSNDFTNNSFIEQIRYLLFEKSSDKNNESSVTRTIPTYINFKVFFEYPFFGVGNGNQGFFYDKYFPSWGGISLGTFSKIRGVADGGVFIPSLFSGYGIIGVFVWGLCTIRYIKHVIVCKPLLNSFYYMFIIAFVAFLVNGFQGDYFGNYMTVFVLCIPFMANRCDYYYEGELET